MSNTVKKLLKQQRNNLYKKTIWALSHMYSKKKYTNNLINIEKKKKYLYKKYIYGYKKVNAKIDGNTLECLRGLATRRAYEEAGIIHKINKWLQDKINESKTNPNQVVINSEIEDIKVTLNTDRKQVKKNIYKVYTLITSVCLFIFYLYLDEIILFNFEVATMIYKNPASFALIYEITNGIFIIASILLFIVIHYDSIKLKYILKKSGNLPIKSKLNLLYFTVLFSIPNKVFVYNKFPNSLTYLTLCILLFLAYLSPILFLPIALYYFCIFESLTFSYIFDQNIKFQTLISKYMFNGNVTLTNVYLKEFWGKSYKGTTYDRFKKGIITLPLTMLTSLLVELDLKKSHREIDEYTKEIETIIFKKKLDDVKSKVEDITIDDIDNIHVASREIAFEKKASMVHKILTKMDVYRENIIEKYKK